MTLAPVISIFHFMIKRWQHTGAFVLQLRPGTHSEQAQFEGQVEHVASGQVLRFRSTQELLAFLTRVLAESGEEQSDEP
jgi:hypothetical protein